MKFINPKSISIIRYKDKQPVINRSVFIADGVRIIGDVEISEGVTVWFNSVIRGDVNSIKIGPDCNIQDNSCLHVEHQRYSLVLEEGITVGHSVTLHGCYLEHHCLIGMGATILNGARIGAESIVGAGALVPEGMIVPARSVVLGCPAKIRRNLNEEQVADLYKSAQRYKQYGLDYSDSRLLDVGN
tara:strand:+ start:11864 stop:12421 length:558 start_codon:yes stop_codon:yes gene_type:complete